MCSLLELPVLGEVLGFVSDGSSLRSVGSVCEEALKKVQAECRRSAPGLGFTWEPVQRLDAYTACSGYRGDGSTEFPYLVDPLQDTLLVRHATPALSVRVPVADLLAASESVSEWSPTGAWRTERVRLPRPFRGVVAEMEAVSDVFGGGRAHHFISVLYLRLAQNPSYKTDWYTGTVRLGSIVRTVFGQPGPYGLEVLPGFTEAPRWPFDIFWIGGTATSVPAGGDLPRSFGEAFQDYQPRDTHLEIELFALEPLKE